MLVVGAPGPQLSGWPLLGESGCGAWGPGAQGCLVSGWVPPSMGLAASPCRVGWPMLGCLVWALGAHGCPQARWMWWDVWVREQQLGAAFPRPRPVCLVPLLCVSVVIEWTTGSAQSMLLCGGGNGCYPSLNGALGHC